MRPLQAFASYEFSNITYYFQIKNGRLNYEAAIKQVDLLLPEELKEPAKAAITACRKVGKYQGS